MKSLLTALSVLTIGTTAGNLISTLSIPVDINNTIVNNSQQKNNLIHLNKSLTNQRKNNDSFVVTLEKLKNLLKENKKFTNKNLLKSKLNENHGVTKVESPWYYFGTYEQVYLSDYVVLNMQNIQLNQDSATAIQYMLDILSPDYWTYILIITANLPTFLLNWYSWNPLEYNTGNGIFWGQTVGNIFTGVWNQ